MIKTRTASSDSVRRSGWALGVLLLALSLCAVVIADAEGDVRTSISRPFEIDMEKAAADAKAKGGEVLRMHWKLTGFLGALAGLFVPNDGDALLTFMPQPERRMQIQMLITAPKREGEYFLYGAMVDEHSGSTESIWSSYKFKDKRKDREQDIRAEDIIDFASAIYRLRWSPPREPTRMTIWNSGKTYAAEIQPLEPEKRKIAGVKMDVQGYAVRGAKVDGKESFKDRMTLYFARNSRSTPVEIGGKRGWVKLRIQLLDAESAGH
jgi:hypothetical protein